VPGAVLGSSVQRRHGVTRPRTRLSLRLYSVINLKWFPKLLLQFAGNWEAQGNQSTAGMESPGGFVKSSMDNRGIHGVCSALKYLAESPPMLLCVQRLQKVNLLTNKTYKMLSICQEYML